MGKDSVPPRSSLDPYFPDQSALKQLADQMELILGIKLEARIEVDNRYIICSEKNSEATDNSPILYLRLRLWWDPRKTERGTGWAKVDYFVLSPPFRRQGWGRKLVELVKAWINSQDALDFICLYARPEVVPFWTKCGFQKENNEERMLYLVTDFEISS